MKLGKEFFSRNSEVVAKELLGMVLVRKIDGEEIHCRIIETEAYYGSEDPASRACQSGDLRETMKMKPGTILVYGVHNNWLINFVTGSSGDAQAVLIRALEPLSHPKLRCSGPGLLTKALKIGKEFHKEDIINHKNLFILNNSLPRNEKIQSSKRIGVKKDLPKNLRFFYKNNKFVSKRF